MKILTLIITLCLFVQTGYAQIYNVTGTDLKINVPDGYYSATRAVIDPQALELFNQSKELLLKNMKENNIYFESFNPKTNIGFTITVIENETTKKIFDFREHPDIINQPEYKKAYKENQKKVFNITIDFFGDYSNHSALYSVTSGFQYMNNTKFHIQRYSTVRQGKAISVTLFGLYDDKANIEKESLLITNNLIYPQSQPPPTPPSKPSFGGKALYKGITGGLSALLIMCFWLIGKYIWNKLKNRSCD